MSNRFSKIALPAAIAATVALSLGAALAQSQQTGSPPSNTQPQSGQPTGAGADQTQTDKSMPMQRMEHGRMMRDQGQKMMQKEHGQMGNAPSGNSPSAAQAQPGQPSGSGTDQQTTGNTSTPKGMEHGRMMRDQGQKTMQNETKMEHGQMGNAPCGQGQTKTQNSGCK